MKAEMQTDLQTEIDRLRRLVGPDERSFEQLRLDWLSMRDATISAEQKLGEAVGRIVALETEAVRLERHQQWLKSKVKDIVRKVPGGGRAAAVLLRR